MTKASLVRKIMKALKKLPKTKLIKLCYELEKRRLPTISTTKKGMPRLTARRAFDLKESERLKRRRRSIAKNPRLLLAGGFSSKEINRLSKRKKPRSAKQRANDKRLGLMAKKRAKAKRRLR
jgi:hypothetical protein